MEDYFANIIFGAVDPHILSITIITGFLIFFMYFYKSKLWCGFSDFDKLSFSIICGFTIFMGFVVPLARIYFTMNNLINGFDFVKIESEEIISTYQLIYSFILLGLFILALKSPKPLYENYKIFKNIFIGYFMFVCILSILCVELIFALLLSPFRDYILTIFGNLFWSIISMVIFFGVYLAVHKNSKKHILKEIERFTLKFQLKKIYYILFLLSLILLPYLVGSVLFSYSIVETGQEFNKIYIEEIDVDESPVFNPPNFIPAERYSFKYYTINPPIALRWVKVTSNLYLNEAYKKSDKKYNYDIKNNNYFIFNESSKTNVTAIVMEEINLSTELKISDEVLPNYDNVTEFFQITLKNNITYRIETDYIELHIDSNYEPIQVTKNLTRTYQKSYTWNKNDSDFDSQIFARGNSLYLRCPTLYQNDSVEFYAILKQINPNQ